MHCRGIRRMRSGAGRPPRDEDRDAEQHHQRRRRHRRRRDLPPGAARASRQPQERGLRRRPRDQGGELHAGLDLRGRDHHRRQQWHHHPDRAPGLDAGGKQPHVRGHLVEPAPGHQRHGERGALPGRPQALPAAERTREPVDERYRILASPDPGQRRRALCGPAEAVGGAGPLHHRQQRPDPDRRGGELPALRGFGEAAALHRRDRARCRRRPTATRSTGWTSTSSTRAAPTRTT